MKRLLWLLPLLFVTVIAAAPPSLPQQGATALSTFLKSATDRGDVPGVVVAVVNKDGVLYNEAFGKSSTLTQHADGEGHDLQHGVDDQAGHLGRHHDARRRRQAEARRRGGEVPAEVEGPARHQQVQRGRRQLRDASGQAADHHPPSADAHVRHRLRVREPDADEDHGEDQEDGAGSLRSSSIRARAGPMAPAHASSAIVVEAISGQKIDAFSQSRILQPARHERHELPGADNEVSARRRRERARRDGKFVERPMPATIACDGAGRRRPVRHGQRLRPVPAHAAQSRHAERQAHPEREVGED